MLPPKNKHFGEVGEKMQSLRRGGIKTMSFIVLLAVSLSLLNFIFGWKSFEEIPLLLQPFSNIILLINPYLVYIQAVLIFLLGYWLSTLSKKEESNVA